MVDSHIRLYKDKTELVVGDTSVGSKDRGIRDFVDSGFVDIGVRYQNLESQILVIEQPPRVHFLTSFEGEKFEIPVPWQVYVVNCATATSRLFFRKEQLTSLDDELFLCYLDHVKPDGSACVDDQHYWNERQYIQLMRENPVQGSRALISDAFWGGQTNGASYMKWYADVPAVIKAEDRWHDISKTLDQKFNLPRVMNEVELIGYDDDFSNNPDRRPDTWNRWKDWFGEPLTLREAIKRSSAALGIKGFFERYV